MTEVQNDLQNNDNPDPKHTSGSLKQKLLDRITLARTSTSDFFREKIKPHLNRQGFARAIQNFDLQRSIDGVSKLVQNHGFAFYGALATVVLSTYCIADLTSLVVGEYIPSAPSTGMSRQNRLGGGFRTQKTINDFSSIYTRNLFNSRGLIPGDEEATGLDAGGPAVKTSLPFNLIGTLIMSNELRSIATIEDKSQFTVFPVGIEDEIPGKARIIKIEPKRVTFMNQANGRKEFVEIPEDMDGARVTTNRISAPSSGPGIEKLSPTQYNVSRNEVDKALSDLNRVLTEARAVPNTENGVPAGWKLFQIVPGSIYDKLGLQNGDVISGVNGNAINDPGKAIEMLNEFKSSNHVELQVKKDGKVQNYVYDIH